MVSWGRKGYKESVMVVISDLGALSAVTKVTYGAQKGTGEIR